MECLCQGRRQRKKSRRKVLKCCRQLKSDDPSLTEICLDELGLHDGDVERISRSLRRNTHLKELHICENFITRLGALDLASAVGKHPAIRELWLSINMVGDDGANTFARTMRNHPTLTWLNLGENGIGPDGAVYLSAALRSNTKLESLWLNGNKIGDEGVNAIAGALQDNALSSLTMLSLNETDITDSGAAHLARCLREEGSKLQILGLYGNFVSNEGTAAIASSLGGGNNTSLSELYLGKNRIGSQGAKAFAVALQSNATLTKLWLSNNKIGDSGASALAEALVDNKTLMELNLSRNGITPKGTRPLGRALMLNRTLVSLGMSGNTILDDGAFSIAHGVGLSSIEELRISEAGVTSEGAGAITKKLTESSRKLSVLDMDGNEIDDEDVLREVSAHNKKSSLEKQEDTHLLAAS